MALAPKKISAFTPATVPYADTDRLGGVQGTGTPAERTFTVLEIRRLPRFTIATKPAATIGEGVLIMLTDGTAGKVAVSNGATWEYMDGTAV